MDIDKEKILLNLFGKDDFAAIRDAVAYELPDLPHYLNKLIEEFDVQDVKYFYSKISQLLVASSAIPETEFLYREWLSLALTKWRQLCRDGLILKRKNSNALDVQRSMCSRVDWRNMRKKHGVSEEAEAEIASGSDFSVKDENDDKVKDGNDDKIKDEKDDKYQQMIPPQISLFGVVEQYLTTVTFSRRSSGSTDELAHHPDDFDPERLQQIKNELYTFTLTMCSWEWQLLLPSSPKLRHLSAEAPFKRRFVELSRLFSQDSA